MNNSILSLLRTSRIATYILLIFYTVGIAGLALELTRPLFIRLTPFALLLSTFFLILHHKGEVSKKLIVVFSLIYSIGFFIEMIGVNTGVIFGEYTYGIGLGIQLWNTPLMIGLNWLLLIYMTASIFQATGWKSIYVVLAGSSLMLLYDLVLENIAPAIDMWSWAAVSVPLQNYIAWWIIAVIMHGLLAINKIKLSNSLSIPVFTIQFVFFLILLLIL
jgi:putative membrane protein